MPCHFLTLHAWRLPCQGLHYFGIIDFTFGIGHQTLDSGRPQFRDPVNLRKRSEDWQHPKAKVCYRNRDTGPSFRLCCHCAFYHACDHEDIAVIFLTIRWKPAGPGRYCTADCMVTRLHGGCCYIALKADLVPAPGPSGSARSRLRQ